MSYIVPPAMPTFRAIEEERHSFLCASWEEHCFIVLAGGALHVLGARQGGIRSHILKDDRLFLVCVLYLIPAHSQLFLKVSKKRRSDHTLTGQSLIVSAWWSICTQRWKGTAYKNERCWFLHGKYACKHSSSMDLHLPGSRNSCNDKPASCAHGPLLGIEDRYFPGRTWSLAPWTCSADILAGLLHARLAHTCTQEAANFLDHSFQRISFWLIFEADGVWVHRAHAIKEW